MVVEALVPSACFIVGRLGQTPSKNCRLTETAYNLGKRPGKQTASPTGPGCLIRPYGRVTISRMFPFTGLPSYCRSFGRIDIGSYVRVGAGAVVIKSVADGLTVVGNPAHPIERN